jgi:hypothetical protein
MGSEKIERGPFAMTPYSFVPRLPGRRGRWRIAVLVFAKASARKQERRAPGLIMVNPLWPDHC